MTVCLQNAMRYLYNCVQNAMRYLYDCVPSECYEVFV